MKNYITSVETLLPKSAFSFILFLTFWLMYIPTWAQEPASCDCEKANWTVKVKVDDDFIRNYVVSMTEKRYDEGAFPEREKLKQYLFYSKTMIVIRLDEAPSAVQISATLAGNKIWYKPEDTCSVPIKRIGVQDKDIHFYLNNLKQTPPGTGYDESRTPSELEKTEKYNISGSYEIVNESEGQADWSLTSMLTVESNDSSCYSARCYMPLYIRLIWDESIFPYDKSTPYGREVSVRPQEELQFTSISTGNTQGEVARLQVVNLTPDTIAYYFPPPLIPAKGKYQGYISVQEITGSVAPGDTAYSSVIGTCFSLHREAHPAGEETTDVEDWYFYPDVGSSPQPGFVPAEDSGFEESKTYSNAEKINGEPTSGTFMTYPGYPDVFPHSIDPNKNPEGVASLLFESLYRIHNAYDSLYTIGEIITPFSDDPEKEKASVTTTTLWKLTAYMEDNPYYYDQFEDKMIKQYETVMGIDYEDAPEEAKEELISGTKEYWTVCDAVGNSAKVLRTFDVTPTTISPLEFTGYCNISGLGVLSVTDADVCDNMGGIYFNDKEEADEYDGPTRDTFPVGLKKVTTSLGKDGQITIGGQVSGQIDSVSRIIVRISNDVETEVKVKVNPKTGAFEVVFPGIHDGTYKVSVEAVMKGNKASYGLTHGRIIVVTDEESTNKGSTIAVSGQTVKVVDVDEDGNVIVEFAGNQHSLKKGESLDVESGIITISEVDTETDAVTFEVTKKKCCGEVPVEEDESIPYTEYGREDLSDEEKEKLGLSGYKGVIFPPNIAKDYPETVIAILPFTALPPFGYRCLSHYWLFNQQSDRFADFISEGAQTFLIQDAEKHNESIPQEEQSKRVMVAERLQLDKVFKEWSLPPDRFVQCVKGEIANLDYVIDGVIGFRCCPLPNDREGVRPYFEAFIVDARDESGKKLDSVSYYSPSCLDPNDPGIWDKIYDEAEFFQKKVNEMARNFMNGL